MGMKWMQNVETDSSKEIDESFQLSSFENNLIEIAD